MLFRLSCLSLFLAAALQAGSAELAAGFRNPPRTCSMVPFWSWNGKLEPGEIRRQMDEMVQQGVYGAFMHAREGLDQTATPYFSEGWWQAVTVAVEHGREVGFRPWIYDEDKWPSGSAGGRVLAHDPVRNARKGLRVIEQTVSGPGPVEVKMPGAQWVIAARLLAEKQVDPTTLRDVTAFNVSVSALDPAPTQGLRVTIVKDKLPCLLEERCRTLGCATTVVALGQPVDLSACDVLISDVGAAGIGVPAEALRNWIRDGGGYLDFTHSEPTAGLYRVQPVVLDDAPVHQWLDAAHPIASQPNANPDASYTGRRWSDMCWRGGEDFAGFAKVLADPRVEGGASLLAREEGKGRVVLCGATQSCREPGAPLELLQNLLVYAGQRAAVAKAAATAKAWSCPEGKWKLFGFVPFSTNDINYLNPQTVRDFLDITHEEYKRRFGADFGTTIPGVFFDEIHNSGVPIVWSESFADEFARRKGYDVWRALVALKADVGPETPKLRCDYYEVYTALYENAWFIQTSDWCAANQLEWTGHTEEDLGSYRNEGDYIRTIRHLQIPGTDNEDFRYTWPRAIDPWKPKQIASVAHVYAKPRAAVEAMGGAGWSFTLDSARYGFNMLSVYGTDFFIPHLFHYAQDSPQNVGDWPNSWFFRNPYWKYFRTLADHASRLNYVLAGSDPVVDVAILYPQSDVWAGNDGGSTRQLLASLVEQGLDADLIDPDSLIRAEIGDGALNVAKMHYRVLIVPGVRCIRRDALAKVAEFAKTGRVLVADCWPEATAEAGVGDPVLAEQIAFLQKARIEPAPAKELSALLLGAHPLDFAATDGAALRYRHVRRDGLDIYWVVNSQRQADTWPIRFRAVGDPAIWNPEDGSIQPVAEFAERDGITSLDLRLDGWQGRFVVFDPSVTRVPQKVAAPTAPRVLQTLADGWRFQVADHALDHAWQDHLDPVVLPLPTAGIRWERPGDDPSRWSQPDCDDTYWRQVKIVDSLHPEAGAGRYRSRWRGRFVSWYNVTPFHTGHGGKSWQARTEVRLPVGGDGWLAVVADGAFSLKVGGQEFSGESNRKPVQIAISRLPAGTVAIESVVADSQGVLIEGELAGVPVATDSGCQASRDGKNWVAAWDYVAPPEKPYGEPTFPGERPLPGVVWYRQALPPGAEAVKLPVAAQAWVDGQVLATGTDWIPLPAGAKTLALRVADPQGLVIPPEVRCGSAPVTLGSWSEQGLDWYSGRALYSITFTITPEQAASGKLALDLGEVCYCAEIWLNGKLVGTRVWPPYRLALGDAVQGGENRLVVVVANLLANRMHWDIFDDAKADPGRRKWHDANLLRDAWCFQSGLLGPVRLEQE